MPIIDPGATVTLPVDPPRSFSSSWPPQHTNAPVGLHNQRGRRKAVQGRDAGASCLPREGPLWVPES